MEQPKNPHARKLGKLGWGKLTPEQRSAIARKAVLTRWENYRKKKAQEKQLEADI